MSTKVMSVLAGIVAALALAAGSTAAPPKAVAVVFGIQNVGFEATCPPDVFGFSFDMVSPEAPWSEPARPASSPP